MSDDAHRSAATAPGYASSSDLPAGFAVGEYRIEGVAGRGGMGVVYAAVQPVIEKKVAIKVLNAQLSSDRELVRRFVDEARAVNRIGHENIIDIFSFGQLPDGRQYFVMEYLDGATLAARLNRGDLSPSDFPNVLAQICEALEAAHAKKIVHRDLKPENVWISASSKGRPRVKLLDFGIAKLLETGERTITDVGAVMGTPHFMSPEQCNGRGVDHRTDIYAMGVLMYRLFTGQLPIQGQTYAEILAKQIVVMPQPPSTLAPLPPALDRLIMACLAKEPAARPQTAGELNAALAAIFGLPNAVSGPLSMGSAGLATLPVSSPVKAGVPAAVQPVSPSAPTAAAAAPFADTTAPVSSGASTHKKVFARAVVGLALLAAAGVAAWVALRPSRSPAPAASVRESAPAPVAAPSPPAPVAAPSPPAAVAPAAPPAVEKPAAAGGARPARAPGTAKRSAGRSEGQPASPAKKPHERAADTGLVTDNPFQ